MASKIIEESLAINNVGLDGYIRVVSNDGYSYRMPVRTFVELCASAETIQDAVDAWLEEHPEAVTTVQDGSITEVKLSADLQETLHTLIAAVGGPNAAATVAEMTDHSKVYVYTGSEPGYTAGNWYYFSNGVWVSGGAYNSTVLETDTTLSVAGMAADAKETGDQITELKEDLSRTIEGDKEFNQSDIIQGTYTAAGAVDLTRTNRIMVYGKMIRVYSGEKVSFVAGSNVDQMAIGYFNINNKAWISEDAWLDTGSYTFDNDYYIYIAFRNHNNANITPSDYDATLALSSPVVNVSELNKVRFDIDSENQLTKFLDTGYYMDLDGVIKVATTFGMSEYIQVKPNTAYNIYSFMRKNKSCGNVYVIYHDILKRFISSTTLQSATAFTTPSECNYIVISAAVTEGKYLYLTDSGVAPTVYKRYGQDTLFNVKSQYNRSRWGNTINWAKMGINLFGTVHEYPKYPHGSKYSFLAAIYEGFDAILIDLISTSDGYYVVSHDDDLYPYAKNSDGTALSNPWNIRQHTLAEVRALDMGYDYGDMYRGTKILTFEEALDFVKKLGATLVVEMVYSGGLDAFSEMVQTVAKYGYTDNVIFFSYYATELARVTNILPEAGLLLYVSGDESTVNGQIQSAINLKTDKNKVIINQFADTSTNVLTENQIQTMIDNNLYYSVSTPTSEPDGFLSFMENAPLTSYITMFGTLNIPAYKMLFDEAVNN